MFHLAQVNIARARAPLTDPLMAEFVASAARVNAEAEAAAGFVWRWVDPPDSCIGADLFGDALIVVNLSVWESLEALRDFVYRSDHMQALRRRAEWFTRVEGPHLALWWVPAGHQPTVHEAKERLHHLAQHGDSATAFTFRSPHPAAAGEPSIAAIDLASGHAQT